MVNIFRHVMTGYLQFRVFDFFLSAVIQRAVAHLGIRTPVWAFLMMSFLCISAPIQAAEVSFSVAAPSSVAKGERFRVTWTLDTRPDEFHAPSFEGFRRISGPSTSSSTSTQIINNQVTTTVSHSYTYVLEALETGTHTISPARAIIDGREHSSDESRIEVTDSPARPAQPRQPDQQQPAVEKPGPDDIFLRTEVSTTSPYRGQQVIVSYKLYTRVSVQGYNIERLPGFQGLWSENITAPGQAQVSRERVNGEIYNVAEIRRVAVFPQRSGEIRIEPMDVELTLRMRRQDRRRPGSMFDDFFGGSPFDRFESISHNVSTDPVTLQVKPLPPEGQPDTFTGMVGDFALEAILDPAQMDVNDATSMVATLSGKGNLRMAEMPELSLPQHLDVFDPQIRDDIRTQKTGIEGSRSFEYVIIPRNTGVFEIPAIEFSYFDPYREEYVTRTAGPHSLQVEGDLATEGPVTGQNDRWLAEDIRFIHIGSVNWQSRGAQFYGSFRFFLLLALPVILLILFLVIWRHHRKNVSDVQALRIKKARKIAVKRLKNAEKLLKSDRHDAFFEEIFRALWGYVSERLNIPPSRLNKENVSTAFASQGVSPDLAERFLEGLHDCEYARFAPAGSDNPMEHTYKKALNTIIALEKELRKKNMQR